jgi:hypothetical protein
MSDDPWFIYRRERGRIRFAPATWQGWLIFFGSIAATIVIALAVMLATDGYSLVVRIVAFTLAIFVGVGALCLLAISKGRPSR